MNPIHVVRKPLVTEKASWASAENNRYAFEVAGGARKTEIKAAIQELYGVRVESVATQNRKGRIKRTRVGWVQEPTTKKAIVKVHPEDTIELF